MTSGNLINDISDHLPNFILVGTKNDRKQNDKPYIRLMSDRNISKFKSYLEEKDWNSLLTTDNCDTSYSYFIKTITIGYEKCFPLVKLSKKRSQNLRTSYSENSKTSIQLLRKQST
jgi:hypothetical protein